MKTGFSLLEILHRENPVFITEMGLQCSHSHKQNFYPEPKVALCKDLVNTDAFFPVKLLYRYTITT